MQSIDLIMAPSKGTIPWNKGLTSQTNAIVKRISENPERARKISEKNKIALKGNTNGSGGKGRIVSLETRKNISKSIKRLFKENPEYREKIKTARAKQKRVYESQHEKLIQQELTKRKIKFKKHRYMKEIKHAYQCDIFIEPKLVIEIDGEYWHNRPKTKAMDLVRTAELEEQGFTVLRIKALSFLDKNYKIHQGILDGIMESIEYEI